MSADARVAVVLPVYNHAARVREVVGRALGLGLPVFVVDDGSTDESAAILATVDGVTLLRHAENRGKGAALLTGFAAAAEVADWAVTRDADGQHEPLQARRLIQAVAPGERPIVLGHREGMAGRHTPWTSRFGRGFSNFWVWCAGGPRVSDSQSGFRLYPLPEAQHLGTRARRFQFEVEVLILARWKGIPVRSASVAVEYAPRGVRVSHFRPFVDFCRNSETFCRMIFRRIFVPRARRARLPSTPYAP